MSATTIDQPGTLTALLTLSAGEDYVIQHDTSSTAAVVVTLTPTVGVTLGDIYTVQDGATLVAESGIAVGFGNEFIIGPGGTFEQLSGHWRKRAERSYLCRWNRWGRTHYRYGR